MMGTVKSKRFISDSKVAGHIRVPRGDFYKHYHCERTTWLQRSSDGERITLMMLRTITVLLLVILLTMHVRSLRVFRWEQSVTGGVLVTYIVSVAGLMLCTICNRCGGKALQVYLTSTGTALLVANTAGIWYRWRHATDLTRAMAELLFALGVPLRRQVIMKVCLSGAAALFLLLDLALVPIFALLRYEDNSDML